MTRQNQPMPRSTEPKRPPGRPELPPQDRRRVGSIRLTEAEWAKFAALGGVVWLREKLTRSKVRQTGKE